MIQHHIRTGSLPRLRLSVSVGNKFRVAQRHLFKPALIAHSSNITVSNGPDPFQNLLRQAYSAFIPPALIAATVLPLPLDCFPGLILGPAG